MQHKLNLEAAAAYGRLFKFVINVEQDKFAQAFEKFLDAYAGDSKPDKTQTVENFQREVAEQRTIPKVGEIYRDTLNYRLKILAVLNDANGYVILMQNCSDFLKSSIRLMTLTDFEKLKVYKED